jgi:hypothetical protein
MHKSSESFRNELVDRCAGTLPTSDLAAKYREPGPAPSIKLEAFTLIDDPHVARSGGVAVAVTSPLSRLRDLAERSPAMNDNDRVQDRDALTFGDLRAVQRELDVARDQAARDREAVTRLARQLADEQQARWARELNEASARVKAAEESEVAKVLEAAKAQPVWARCAPKDEAECRETLAIDWKREARNACVRATSAGLVAHRGCTPATAVAIAVDLADRLDALGV